MSVLILINNIISKDSGARGKCSLLKIKLEFRGSHRYSAELYSDGSDNIIKVDQIFVWAVDSPAHPGEVVTLELLACKGEATYVIGTCRFWLQELLAERHLARLDWLVDHNDAQLPVCIDYKAFYRHPGCRQGSSGNRMNRKKLPVVPPVHAPAAPAEHALQPAAAAEHAPRPSTSRAPAEHAPRPSTSRAPAEHTPQPSTSRAPAEHAQQPSTSRVPAEHAPQPSTSRAPSEHVPRPSTSWAPAEYAPQPSTSRAPAEYAPQPSTSRAPSVHAPRPSTSRAPAENAPQPSTSLAPSVYAPRPSTSRAPAEHAPQPSTSRAPAMHTPRPSTSRRNSVPRAGPSSLSSDFDEAYPLDNLQSTMVQIEQSMPRETVIDVEPVDESPTRKFKMAGKHLLRRGVPEPSDTVIDIPPPERERKPFKAMRDLMRLGRARRRTPDEEQGLLPVAGPSSAPDLPPSPTTVTSSDEILVDTRSYPDTPRRKRKTSVMGASGSSANKAADFQVCVTILEARHLTGLNLDPVVCVQVGDERKLTSVKESTNCPYYNEYFVFDFHEPPIILLDKIITLSVMHSRHILRTNKLLGTFKLDVATVWNQPDRQFYHKWALLTDPDDVMSGPKGYLKVDISVIGKGDAVKVPPKSEKDEDDIEANLLLPDGVTVERQRCRYIVNIHRADGLPKMNYSILANVKRAFTGETQDLVDPYVQVAFAGMSGQTTVKKNCCNPVWNEQVVFTEMFPPLCQRIKFQLCDKNPVHPSVIGTHFIDLKNISHDGETAGFLPNFGPSYIYFYGSTRDYSLLDQHSDLNTGMGEGLSYRARLLVSIRTEIMDIAEIPASEVEVEPIMPINEQAFEKNEEFLLFASIFDVNMIDKRLTDKPIYFEMSIGNAGNTLDGHYESVRRPQDLAGDLDELNSDVGYWQSTTDPMKASSTDKMYYHLPFWDYKRCMHVRSVWPDHRRRMYNSNLIADIINKFEEGLSDAQIAADQEGGPDDTCVTAVKSMLVSVSVDCANYVTRMKSAPPLGNTKLDRQRLKLCISEMEQISALTRNLKARITRKCLKDRLRTAFAYLNRLKRLREDPQPSMPDVFLWMISTGKRLAYLRINPGDIIFAEAPDERGRLCGKIQTLFLKWPGKKSGLPSGWAIPAKLTIYAWLGVLQDKKHFIDGLPLGYEHSSEIKNHEKLRAHLPSLIFYAEKHTFQLRAYIYQARSLIGSDTSGLSDPYARVIVGDCSGTTQVIEQTLSPTWDELIVLDDVLIYGTVISIKANPPTIVVEIFDQDKVGKSEFIGRILAKPVVICHQELDISKKFPPTLEWFEVYRGDAKAGELLATFELLEIPPKQSAVKLPALPQPKSCAAKSSSDVIKYVIYPIPEGIRPTLSTYRLEVLFWGLRDLKRIHLLTVDKPRVEIECAGIIIHSTVIQNAKRNPNFANPIKYVADVDLPDQDLYRPPLTIRVVDCRSFGRETLVGSHTINSINKYIYTPMSKRERDFEEPIRSLLPNMDFCDDYIIQDDVYTIENERESCPLLAREGRAAITYGSGAKLMRKKFTMKGKGARNRKANTNSVLDDNESSKDWWTKYYASYESMIEGENENKNEHQLDESQVAIIGEIVSPQQEAHCSHQDPNRPKRQSSRYLTANLIHTPTKKIEIPKSGLTKIYPHELEAVPEYEEFKDWLHSFELYRGKKTNDEPEDDNRVVGVFKGALKVYKWPLSRGMDDHTVKSFDPNHGFFHTVPNNDPKRVLIRIYIVKATDLHPMDLNGKADPYLVLKVGSKKISDKENYVSKQLNPVFGKCFEFEATFPQDSMLTIQVYDWDLLRTDELIGETKIDLENRYYSRHRATCGLPKKYEEQGYNRWRDATKPTQILARLCKDGKLDAPIYEYGRVTIGRTVFNMSTEENELCSNSDTIEEQMALNVLLRWQEMPGVGCHLVTEHVETRSLYNPNKPGIEQGRLQMWVDMFPMDSPLPGPAVDISARKPKSYEMRVIVWNTEDVVLEDDAFFTGEKMSDIYVKGWVKGPEDCQSTDIHYRSLTGEGNFNWRFKFPFQYLEAEERIVITKKESIFSWDETECKIPARLELQVWDSDHFTLDDFLGAVTLNLNRFPRGAKSSKLCTLEMLRNDGNVPLVNLFKQKRIKGWWPVYIMRDTEEMEQTGKIEAEIHLLTQEEAERAPAGLGRSEPDPLDKPNRPDASFVWFLNPLRSIRYIAWQNYKKTIIKFSFVFVLALFIFLLFFNVPGYLIKKILGA